MVHLLRRRSAASKWAFAGMISIILMPAIGEAYARSYAYIANYGGNTVSVIDTTTRQVVTTINVGAGPGGVAVAPGGSRVYISNYNGASVSVVDTATNVVTATIPVGTSPNDMAVLPDGSRVYVANSGSNSVSVIDAASNTVTKTISVGIWPVGAVAHPGGTKVYVANRDQAESNVFGTVSVVDTATDAVVNTITVGKHPHHMAVSPDGTKIYVANHQSAPSVSVIDTVTDTVTATITGPGSPVNAAVTPDGAKVYVTNRDHDNVSVIMAATNTIIATIPVGDFPYGIAVVPGGSRVFVTNAYSNTISLIDPATDTVVGTIVAGSQPYTHGAFITPSIDPPSGRVAWWKAENDTADAMGFNNGTAVGGVGYSGGMTGQAFDFNGSASYVQAADSPSLDLTTHFTLEAWVYPRSFSGDDKAIISKVGGGGGNNGYQFALGRHDGAATTSVWCGFNAASEDWPANSMGGGSVPTNAWSHVACTYDHDTMRIYVNGIPAGSNVIGAKSVVNSTCPVRISGDGNNHVWFNGLIDEAAVYNRALSAREIAANSGNIPDAFSFAVQTDQPILTIVESEAVTVLGTTGPTAIGITGGEYAVSADGGTTWGAWTGVAGTVNLNDKVKVRLTSSASSATTAEAVLTIGGREASFRVTTAAIPLASLRLWLRADMGLTKSETNQVSRWADFSGDGFDVAQGTAALQPLLVEGAVNGKPAIRFDGGDDYLQTGSVNLLCGTGVYTLFVAVKPETSQNNAYADMVDYAHAGNLNFVIQQNNTATNQFGIFGIDGVPLSAQSYQVYAGVFAVTPSVNSTVFVNGNRRAQASGFAAGSWNEPNYFAVGNKSNAQYPRQFKGDIAEVIVYNTPLGDADRQAVEGYLMGKYGIDVTPETFSFSARTEMPFATVIESFPVTITGINAASPVTISGGEFALSADNGATWSAWAASGTVLQGNLLKVRQTSSTDPLTRTETLLTIGGVSGAFLVTTASATDPRAHGLISWWRGEDSAQDSIGGNHGTLQGAATYAAGQVGKAFSFNGANGAYLNVPDHASLNAGTSQTIEFWILFNSFPSDYKDILQKGIASGKCQYYIRTTSAAGWTFSSFIPGYSYESGNLTYGSLGMSPGKWHHVAFVVNGDTQMGYVYVDGSLKAGFPGNTHSLLQQNTAPLTIGGSFWDGYFDGRIDEVRIFNRALSSADVGLLSGMMPAAFSFTPVTGAAFSRGYTAAETVTVSGLTYPAPVSIAGGEYELNGSGIWSASAASVSNGDTVRVRQKSAASFASTTTVTLTIGGASAPFAVTTNAVPTGSWTDSRASSFAGGDGSAGTPYLIATAEQLALLAFNAGSDPGWTAEKQFALTGDIDLAAHQWAPVAEFRGALNGRGHRIGNLTIDNGDADYQGLFSQITSGAVVSNIGLVNVSVVGRACAGSLAGGASSATVMGCYATGSVNGNNDNGGLIGCASDLSLSRSWSSCAVTSRAALAAAHAGGLVGDVGGTTTISSSYATGPVIIPGGQNSGGLIGLNYGGHLTVANSYSTGDVITNVTWWNNVGGFLGLAGPSSVTAITDSYSAGVIVIPGEDSSGKTGGVVGGRDGGAWISVVNGYYNSANPPGQGGGTALSAVEMRTAGFAATLNGSQSPAPWLADEDNQNGGFPFPAGLPTPYAFTAQTGVQPGTQIVSNELTLFDIASPSTILLSACTGAACQFRSNNGEWTASSGTVNNGDTVTVRLTSADTVNTTAKAVLTIGGIGYPFRVTTVPPCTTAPAGLVSWWQAEGNARDAIGANHGSLVGGAAYAAGRTGQAFSFDGVDGYVESTTPSLTWLSNTFTMAFWALPQGERTRTVESNSGIAGLDGQRYAVLPEWGGYGSNAGAGVSVGTNGISVAEHRAGYIPTVLVYDAVLDGWTHIAVVYDNGTPRLYVNGAWVRTGAVSAYSVFPSKLFGTFSSLYGPYHGLLDEVGIYNRALADAEIAAIHGAGGAGMCPDSGCVKSPGDVNYDGAVTLADAILTLRIAVGPAPDAPGCAGAADADGDGRIGAAETLFILHSVAGLRP